MSHTNSDSPELLAPAGNWDCAKAAVENGADAIYFGLEQFNARMRAQNFTQADLPKLMTFLHQRGVKGYVTLNTLVFSAELAQAEAYLRSIISAGVDAVIVQDIGICRLIRHLSLDFPIHASTQMTVTSAQGVAFAKDLGCQLVVLARECSIKDINKIQQQLGDRGLTLPLEVFVHGALCVAYSGQCLTSEALGGRSANRGECAQACRMPYDLIVDGKKHDLDDGPSGSVSDHRRYLLSPQDLAGLDVLPELVQSGVTCLKIEGRLKTPEYVASVTRVYRQALDRIQKKPFIKGGRGDLRPASQAQLKPEPKPFSSKGTANPVQSTAEQDRYKLEMAFSRGLYTGWFNGIDNQALVHARFGKKRGVYLGQVRRIQGHTILIDLQAPLKPGDGIVFDNGHPAMKEEGGRIYGVSQRDPYTALTFGRNDINFNHIQVGDKLWKTSDPELDKQIRQTYAGDTPRFQHPIDIELHGAVDLPLTAIARDTQGQVVQVESTIPLVTAHNRPLTPEKLTQQFARLGNTPFRLGNLSPHLEGDVMLPVSELNRMRRSLVEQLDELRSRPKRWQLKPPASYRDLLPLQASDSHPSERVPELIILVRNLAQLQVTLDAGIETLYCELEDPPKYGQAVALTRQINPNATLFVAPPRIAKPLENYILDQVKGAGADGYLIRNYDQLAYFAESRCVGDFSLNVANPLTAAYFKQTFGLERLTASYDLNAQQLEDLLRSAPPQWFEITLHQHMPMFHMEHCVFCAFLSTGKDFRDCGRPCEKHEVKLRDRVGTEHVLQADAGCRNTVFNGTAQTGAEYVHQFLALGATRFRLEFLHETPEQVGQIIAAYQSLLDGKMTGTQLWQTLKLQRRLGVTRGSLEKRL
ncbi:MAG: U32 family peptidase [Cyanobacteria bacterium J06635_15]